MRAVVFVDMCVCVCVCVIMNVTIICVCVVNNLLCSDVVLYDSIEYPPINFYFGEFARCALFALTWISDCV